MLFPVSLVQIQLGKIDSSCYDKKSKRDPLTSVLQTVYDKDNPEFKSVKLNSKKLNLSDILLV